MLAPGQFLCRTGVALDGTVPATFLVPARSDAFVAPLNQGFGPSVADLEGMIGLPGGFRHTEMDVVVEGSVKTLIMPDNITVDRAGNLSAAKTRVRR